MFPDLAALQVAQQAHFRCLRYHASPLSADLPTVIQTVLEAVPDAEPDQIDRLFRRNGMTFYKVA